MNIWTAGRVKQLSFLFYSVKISSKLSTQWLKIVMQSSTCFSFPFNLATLSRDQVSLHIPLYTHRSCILYSQCVYGCLLSVPRRSRNLKFKIIYLQQQCAAALISLCLRLSRAFTRGVNIRRDAIFIRTFGTHSLACKRHLQPALNISLFCSHRERRDGRQNWNFSHVVPRKSCQLLPIILLPIPWLSRPGLN